MHELFKSYDIYMGVLKRMVKLTLGDSVTKRVPREFNTRRKRGCSSNIVVSDSLKSLDPSPIFFELGS